jgi:Mrp family chromosome partitioning ATPase
VPLDLYPAGAWQPEASLLPAKRKGLADQLLARAIGRCFVVAIVGTPETAWRKSRVAKELALALSASGAPRTLLVDANLQHPMLHHVFGITMPASRGFSQQLHARIRGGHELAWGVVACRSNLHALVEGLVLSPGVVLSKHFEACIRELRSHYDLIVIDGPLSSQGSDYRAVTAVADGMLRLEGPQSSPGASPQLFCQAH